MDCYKYNLTNWVVAFIAGLLEYHRQAQGWERVQEFDKEQVLSVPQGYYVELNFTIHSKFPLLCIFGSNLEIRDGSNQSANFLGEFCGDYGIGVLRSSGRYMWLKFSSRYDYDFTAFYTGRANNETGMEFLSIYIYVINKICDYCSSWCKIDERRDELYSFVSRRCHYGCWSRCFDCNTASLHQVMRSIVYVLLFVAR